MKIARPTKVLDASAAAALLFGEPSYAGIKKRIADFHLAAPLLLKYEMASVARKKHKVYGYESSAVLQLLDDFSHWELDWFDVPSAKCFEVAASTGLSTYDAAYLWLARELGAELVTLDERLQAVAGTPE